MSKKGSFLGKHESLLERLERSRGKNKSRKVNDSNSRSYDERKAESDRRQAEYHANQDRYRGDFEIVGGGNPGMAYSQVVTGYYNPETGATWSAPHSGYKPKEGTGWVKGYGPKTDFRNMGRPAVGYDTRITIPEADMYKRLHKESKTLPPKTTEETTAKGKKFEDLLRSRMSKF
jgi:hypothetical protein